MKALIVTGPNAFRLEEVPLPECGPYDCLVKIDACAVCTGTDSDIIAATFPFISPYPTILGHESTGLVVEVGAKVKRFHVGQRVTRPAAVYAGEKLADFSSTWGGYAEYGKVRDVDAASADGVESSGSCLASRNPLQDGVSAVDGALSINQREILSVVDKIHLDESTRVLVIGSGYNGLLFALFTKLAGSGRVILAGNPAWGDRAMQTFLADGYVDYRTPAAVKLCEAALGGKPTHVIDAVGSLSSLGLAQSMLAAGSAFGCYGLRSFEAAAGLRGELETSHPRLDMGTDEASYVGLWEDMYAQGVFSNPGLCDAVMPFEQVFEAFDILKQRKAVKIVLTMA